MDAEMLLKNEDDRAFLMNKLEELMEKHGFDSKIGEFVDSLVDTRMADVADINQIFDKLYDFVITNLPPEIQEAFYYDVRSFIERSSGLLDQ
ncbi:ECU07_0985 [Encephalitozoon cuniculi GB-M1]|uniref:ECU07_0985 protein n=1 Tax=Encephalitozoon cuniculi (strain GB-M1) TaxID=284813 RepID=I7L4H1_ENCCU|nr:uncharacterized protein ECU07_0985 [Encephalitozoon cuniculi GB-M1]UYI27259.1 hypothetical protein J0A71_05g11180 [Encephalitozoon cuniculi]CCI73955.1 ECU07_0985 [Encephalitozoon cuniculi GB-M1]